MKKAFVTTLTDGDGYLPGAEALAKSLDATGSKVPRVVLVTADVSTSARARLEIRGWDVRDVEAIRNPHAKESLTFSRFSHVFTKLRAWDLTDFDRVVFLDADTLVLKNVDELFFRPAFAAAPDFFLPDRFNSGVMVIEPSAATFAEMVTKLATMPTYDGGDQGFLNSFYSEWYSMPVEHRLPVGYNVANFIFQFAHGHPSLKATLANETKILHYMVQKPWQAKATLTGGAEEWWSMYFEAHPEKAARWKDRVHTIEDWAFDKLAAMVVD